MTTKPPTSARRNRLGLAVGAVILAAVGLGAIDIPYILGSLTPRGYATAAAYVVTGQIRWGAAVAAVVLALFATGVITRRVVDRFLDLLVRGDETTFTIIVVGVAVALRAAYASAAPPPPVSDEQYYLGLGQAILGGSYSWEGAPTAYWPMGYPALLAPFLWLGRGSYLGPIILQVFLGAGTALITYRIGRKAIGERGGRVAGLIVAVLPSQVAYAARLFPAVAFTFLLVLAAWVVTSRASLVAAALAGVIAGAAALIAPVCVLLPAAFVVTDILKRLPSGRIIARATVAALVFAAAVTPWAYRNWRTFGAFIPFSTNAGVNLWVGNNPNATGTYYYPTSTINPLFMAKGEVARNALGISLSRYYVRTQREKALASVVPKFVYLYGSDTSAFQLGGLARGWRPALSAKRAPARVAQAAYALLILSVVASLWTWRRFWLTKREGYATLIWPLYITLAYLAFFGQDRFHFAAIPFLAIVAARLAEKE